ncbi:hypothetical protein HY967_03530 [Candidatus Jorgensenbacteria bacterium]|nr:hypothetical protein [Candidatus Jorgensenbacteria bacterium]
MKNALPALKFILRFIARSTVRRYRPRIVGVTGSVGKSSTKEALGVVLGHERRVRAPSKSFNNEIGLPLTLIGSWIKTGGVYFWLKVIGTGLSGLILKKPEYPEVIVLEYGVDRPGDMKYLLDIARPEIGIFTAMGDVPVHVEFFNGPEGILREKSKLISQLPSTGFAVLNIDDPMVWGLRDQTRAQVMSFGFSKDADVRINNFVHHYEGDSVITSFKLEYGGSVVPVRLENVLGKGQAYAAAGAAAIGLIFGMNLVAIAESLRNYRPPQGRLTVIRGIKESIIIDDSYNASPLAMREALTMLKELKAKRKIAVLGDMLELGKYTLGAHTEVGELTAKTADLLITVGLRGKLIAEAAARSGFPKKSISVFMSVSEAGLFLQNKLQPNDLVLIKGSQGVRMERIVQEVMAEPMRAPELLVRQDKEWLGKPGLYE